MEDALPSSLVHHCLSYEVVACVTCDRKEVVRCIQLLHLPEDLADASRSFREGLR